MMTSYFRPEVEIRPFRACAMHLAIIIGTVRSLWTWLWCRYHITQNAFLVLPKNISKNQKGDITQHTLKFGDVLLSNIPLFNFCCFLTCNYVTVDICINCSFYIYIGCFITDLGLVLVP